MFTFIFTFLASMVACLMLLLFWDSVETLVMDIGEIMDEVREKVAHPAPVGAFLTTVRPLLIGMVFISISVAVIASI